MEEWKRLPHLARLKPLVQDWGVNGFGTPYVVYLLYIVKLVIYSVGAALVISTTPGLGGLGDFGDWWTEPIVWQKLVGLDAPVGDHRPRMRLDAAHVPLQPDDRRDPLLAQARDGAPAALAGQGAADEGDEPHHRRRRAVRGRDRQRPVLAPRRRRAGGRSSRPAGSIPRRSRCCSASSAPSAFATRSRSSGARVEVYGFLLVVFLFPISNLIVASQIVLFCIWWGAASSKLNRHFPFVVSVMISNTPWNKSRTAKKRLWKRPSRGHAPVLGLGVRGAPRHGDGVHPAADPARDERRARWARSPRSG